MYSLGNKLGAYASTLLQLRPYADVARLGISSAYKVWNGDSLAYRT